MVVFVQAELAGTVGRWSRNPSFSHGFDARAVHIFLTYLCSKLKANLSLLFYCCLLIRAMFCFITNNYEGKRLLNIPVYVSVIGIPILVAWVCVIIDSFEYKTSLFKHQI